MKDENVFGEHNLETAKHSINMDCKSLKRAFCIVCGELEIKDAEIIHPALDKAYYKLLKNGFTTTYTQDK